MEGCSRAPGEMTTPLASAVRSGGKDALSKVLSRFIPSVAKSELIADHAKGTYVWTVDGQKHLDMACGIGTMSTGHCHPAVVKAIQEQAPQMIHAQQNIFAAAVPQVELLERLRDIVPTELTRYFFCNSGSEAVDNAVKIARAHTGKQNIISFENSFHGRTYGAMALTNSKVYYRQGFGPLMPGTPVAPYPYCLQCKVRQAAPNGDSWYSLAPSIDDYDRRICCNGPQEALNWMLKQQTAPGDTAAIIVEPILGEGGFLTPPPNFFPTLRELCDKHGMLLIIDEVQSGVGRTGKWWGHQHFPGAEADIMLFAKGIASGFPFAGLVTKEHLGRGMDPGTMGGTYGGSVLGCAAACATLDAIQDEKMLDNARERGKQLVQGLLKFTEKYPIIDIRGRGLMVAAEFGGKDGSLSAEYGVASAVTKACGKRNMILLTAGARETIRFLPPLNVKKEEIEEALQILGEALADVFGK
ncbi:hypothetical protein WJX72_003610 [[Myrmecia] bisecta]|uniref:4-aminobutyrate aminotransferase n=1 Tax=[Myrmecia] bisecta TaxID=41462 RepID=A0AAW1PWX2_9CHLO